MDRLNMQESSETFMIPAEITVAGRLDIGVGKITSPLKNDEQIAEYAERAKEHIVKVDSPNCAVCMDGRSCKCLASEIDQPVGDEAKKPPVRPKMAGGLYDMATMMAVLGGWKGLSPDIASYAEAREQVGAFLAKEGYQDGAHSSVLALDSDNSTDCGAWDKKALAMSEGSKLYAETRNIKSSSAVDTAIAAINGLSDVEQLLEDSRYQSIRSRQISLVDNKFFETFNPAETKKSLRSGTPEQLEVLNADANHPAHGHKEPMFIVNMKKATTLDRDAMGDDAAFCDDRWFRQEIAHLMASSAEEETLLLMAGDVTTVDVSHQLVARGMPVAIVQ